MYLQLLFLRMENILLALIKVMITWFMFMMLQVAVVCIKTKVVLMLSLTVAFPELKEITLFIQQVSNITLYGTGRVKVKKKVYLVIHTNAPVSLAVSLMIKVIPLQEVQTLRSTSGMEIRSNKL